MKGFAVIKLSLHYQPTEMSYFLLRELALIKLTFDLDTVIFMQQFICKLE